MPLSARKSFLSSGISIYSMYLSIQMVQKNKIKWVQLPPVVVYTNNLGFRTVQLYALKLAFNIVLQSPYSRFIIFTDSLSSLAALNGSKLDHPYVLEILEKYSRLVQENSVVLAWVPSHVGIRGNDKADILAKDALDMDVTNVKIPYTDLKVNITRYFTNKWQEIWDTFPDNKLYAIQTEVTNTSITLDKRRDDIVITRARIGHRFTYSKMNRYQNAFLAVTLSV